MLMSLTLFMYRERMTLKWLMMPSMKTCNPALFLLINRNITDMATNDLLGGLCPRCYRVLEECKCDERIPITEVNRSGRREEKILNYRKESTRRGDPSYCCENTGRVVLYELFPTPRTLSVCP